MVVDHLEILLEECEAMIKEERRDDMRHFYLLLRDVKDGMNTLVDVFGEHIKQHGIRVIEYLKQEQVY